MKRGGMLGEERSDELNVFDMQYAVATLQPSFAPPCSSASPVNDPNIANIDVNTRSIIIISFLSLA